MPISAGASPASASACLIARAKTIAVAANREQSLAFGCIAAAEHLAQDDGVALVRGVLGFERERARALAEYAAAAPRVERADGVGRKQAALMVVEHHLRLDRRIVPDGDRAIGFALAQRFRPPR